MIATVRRTGLGTLLAFSLAQAQTAEKPVFFDAASIKPTSPNTPDGRIVVGGLAPIGGPGTSDPGRIRFPVISLKLLVVNAYDVKSSRITGPAWMDDEFFEIQAVMPPDTTKEQFRAMLRNLLSDRFHLKVHRETEDAPGFALVVAKGGPKMKESAVTEDPSENVGTPSHHAREEPFRMGADGFPVHPNVPARGAGLFTTIGTKAMRLTGRQQTMSDLARVLTIALKQPVEDATRLSANYDFILTFAPPNLSTGSDEFPSIFSALQSGLGLKLERRKSAVETLIVDHVERTPSGN